ncbi:hypothetical protein ACLOJK_013178 [Asimina triloba]
MACIHQHVESVDETKPRSLSHFKVSIVLQIRQCKQAALRRWQQHLGASSSMLPTTTTLQLCPFQFNCQHEQVFAVAPCISAKMHSSIIPSTSSPRIIPCWHTACTPVSQLHPPQISHPVISSQPPPSKRKRKSCVCPQSSQKIVENERFSGETTSVSTRIDKPTNPITSSTDNPDAESTDLSDSLSIEQFLDHDWLASMLQSCLKVKEARGIHGIIVKGLGGSVTFVDNNLIASYGRFRELVHARRVFDTMLHRDIVSWTAMLNGYLKIGADDVVYKLFSDLIASSLQANSSTYVCILNLCGRKLDWKLGRQIHASVVKGSWGNLFVDSALVYLYAQCGDLSTAVRVFDRMPERDVVCWTTIIGAFAQHGHAEEAFSMFLEMQLNGFKPNEFTVSSVLKACREEKVLKYGQQLHGAIVKKVFHDDVFIGSSLLTMYVRCGQVLNARMVFDRMRRRNMVTWTSMIAGYAQNGLGEEAICLYRRMRQRRVFADTLTAVCVLSACGMIGSLITGKEVHAKILKSLIGKNLYIESTLMWFYSKCGEHIYATRVLESMPWRDTVAWTAIISGYAHLGRGSEALHSFNDMLWEGVEPNPFTYSSVLKACAKQEAVRQGEWIHASVRKTHALSNTYVATSLFDMYAKCGYLEDAARIFDRMPERNLASWRAMITAYAKNGLCIEALKLLYRMKKEGIKRDFLIVEAVTIACGGHEWDMECPQTHCSQTR